ncbi:hypothetical protein NUW58_g3538 [Xylaria curta]|uniref:Uncharacterized protein n=1 Tax=Xylaria curta TaxID=42375 RepID=A0ACC1PD82_9PEZI|nr:hypothetical protein NUW58_g3538 [Xylaria curta]
MSLFSSEPEAGLGSLGVTPFIPFPPLPNIVAEWAAILPLVCHLASPRDDYITTGDVALLGRLSVGIFPRLGTLSGLARLLGRGTKYLDHASTRGGSSRTVWDVKWGSVFPCANGAACAAISKCLISRGRPALERMPETSSPDSRNTDCGGPTVRGGVTPKPLNDSPSEDARKGNSREGHAKDDGIRRYQILHVYQLYQTRKRFSLRHRFNRLRLSAPVQIVWFFFLTGLAILLGLLGNYGSAALIVCASASQLVALGVTIRRPISYLKNNEAHDACMLVAAHENATEWHLYIGDRAVTDTLLNKPMFVLPEGRLAHLAANWFWFANLLQFAAMTFVAAQKGWDSVWMVVFLAIHWAVRCTLYGQTLALDWLEREGIDAKVRSFEFGGRYAMMGAIQVFSRSASTRWMDDILTPHPRREAWLKLLKGEVLTDEFDSHDSRWLKFASEGSFASADVLKHVFGARGRSKALV